MRNTVKIGSRGSRLAKAQVDEVLSLLKAKGIKADFQVTTYTTKGDKDKKTPLAGNPPDDFFTDALDRALLGHAIDIAVHSAKDLPRAMPEGLSVIALTESIGDTDAFVGETAFADLPDGARIGTSSALRQNAVKALRPDLRPVNIRGTIEERIALIEKGVCDGIIVATAALKRLGLEDRARETMPWETTPLQGQLAVVGRGEDTDVKELFSPIDARRTYGRVWLVGAGPGDPDLITLKGIKALREADCVFYDYLAHKDILGHAPEAEKVYVGKRKGEHTMPQPELLKQLRQKALNGKNVVRLKGGDPLIFGRGAEEISYLRAYHISVGVIPGVSSATAIPASLCVPLTARDLSSSVAFISGHGKDEKSSRPRPVAIPDADTLVFLMGLTKIKEIVRSMRKAGWRKETPIMVISRGTCDNEQIVAGTLETIVRKAEQAQPQQPALIIAGATVQYWDPRLYKREGTVLFVGTNPQKYSQFGTIVHWPMIAIGPVEMDPKAAKALIAGLSEYHMVLLTSKFAVKYFFRVLEEQKVDLDQMGRKKFLVIGKNTARALRDRDFEPALVAAVETGEGLLKAIKARMSVKGKRILFPRSSLPNPYLRDELTKLGARVDEVSVYQNIKPPKRELPKVPIDKVLFTSPSTVRNFLADYGQIPKEWKILSKGPVTSECLKEAGYESEVLTYE